MALLDSEQVRHYRSVAAEFCTVVEARDAHTAIGFAQAIHQLLPRLYSAATVLPSSVPETDQSAGDAMSHEDWRRLHFDLSGLFGRWNFYWLVFDPYDNVEREPVCGSLADDLADIYRDLSDGRLDETLRGALCPADVVWAWKQAFETHWSAHATGALRALNAAFFLHHAHALPESFESGTGEAAPGEQPGTSVTG